VARFATEYLEAKAAGFGFTGPNAVRESYTSANSGCTTAQGSRIWQNVVFTLPGQVDFAQSQQVIFLVHYDTISESATKDANNAPGADDAISGGMALLEAMRLFKDFAWQRPVKFLFVSGEEVGLCGSTAYTRMHPAGPMFRVLNMDQTAFDGNKNGLMNLYNFNTTNCPSCVAFGDAFVQANADYGNIIAPAKIVRNTTRMCQTDHCPFWNVGATAIDLNEDLTNNDICPCFDQSQTSTCRDTVTQFFPTNSTTLMFDQNYSWPTQKAAIALIAHTSDSLPGAAVLADRDLVEQRRAQLVMGEPLAVFARGRARPRRAGAGASARSRGDVSPAAADRSRRARSSVTPIAPGGSAPGSSRTTERAPAGSVGGLEPRTARGHGGSPTAALPSGSLPRGQETSRRTGVPG